MTAADAAQRLSAKFPGMVVSTTGFRGETTLSVKPEALHAMCAHARDALGFDLLLDISSVDHLGETDRWELVHELYSLDHHVHLRVKARMPGDQPEFDSVADLWPTANWHEREVYDMMGIRFTGHPDLRRILMWDGYPFHPLRKEFPLAGKSSEMPDVAFSSPAPLAGGPFVTTPGGTHVSREPRSHGE